MYLRALPVLAALPGVHCLLQKDNVGKLPALGWNSWNAFYCDIDEAKIMTAATQMVALGLKDVGYEYVNNACVPELSGGPYPNGTCPDLQDPAPEGYDWSQSNSARRYELMRDALLAQNRTILYSICSWGLAGVNSWGNATGNSWRSSGDIDESWARIMEIFNFNSFQLNSVGFWGRNDPDMLEVGNGALTDAECRSHFAFWAAMKSPVIIGTELGKLKSSLVDLLKNQYLLSFNQDEVYGGPAVPYKWGVNPDWTFNKTNPAEYWSGRSTEGTLVLALNSLGASAARQILWEEVPELKSGRNWRVTDIWSGKSRCVAGGIHRTLQSHDTMGFIVGEQCGEGEAESMDGLQTEL
ncbi:unnamed protein product [Diplocarpon coronariae]